MESLLRLSRGIDSLTDGAAVAAKWAVLLSCLISAANAAVRYTFDFSSNGFLEIQWYLFGAMVMLGNGGGPGSVSLHNPRYDFNDMAIPFGVSFFVQTVERFLDPRPAG